MRRKQWGDRKARGGLALLSGLLLAAAMIAGSAEPAAAYTYWRTGAPGKVIVTDQIQGTHYQFCVGGYWINGVYFPNCDWSPALVAPPLTIKRSPRSKATQVVTVTWQIQRVRGDSWYVHTQGSNTYTIRRGKSSVTTYQWNRVPTAAYSMRMVLRVKWTHASSGKSLGHFKAIMNQRGDYRCATRFPCSVQNSYIWLKSPSV